jgi:hypothetical protein
VGACEGRRLVMRARLRGTTGVETTSGVHVDGRGGQGTWPATSWPPTSVVLDAAAPTPGSPEARRAMGVSLPQRGEGA